MDNGDDRSAKRENGLARIRRAYQNGADSGRAPTRVELTVLFPELTQEINGFFDSRRSHLERETGPDERECSPESDFAEPRVNFSVGPESPVHGSPSSEATTLPRSAEDEAATDQRIGAFGDYELLQRIGQGGDGAGLQGPPAQPQSAGRDQDDTGGPARQ